MSEKLDKLDANAMAALDFDNTTIVVDLFLARELVAQLEAELDMYERDETFASLAIQVVDLEADNEALKLKAKHVAQSVNVIRSVMRLNREHKDLFGGAVYLVDHTHMWALIRNAEDLDALLTGENND